MDFLTRLRDRFDRMSIYRRILIGNSLVIIVGAIGGTWLTRHLAAIQDVSLIILFVTLGLLLTLLVNYFIVHTVLSPLRELRKIVNKAAKDHTLLSGSEGMYKDPDLQDLVSAINEMLSNLQQRTLQLRALSERALNAQEDERKRIARGLHDDTAQSLSTLIIHLEQIEYSLPEDQAALRHKLAQERKLVTNTLDELRNIIWGLRPSILDDLGLSAAIRWYARSKLEAAGVQADLNITDEIKPLGSPVEDTIFRIMQEAVSNILHHSKAHTANFHLWLEEDRVCLEVKDDGQGFDVHDTEGQALYRKQLGLLGIQERASLIGGQVEITSTPGQGTRVYVSIPILASSPAATEASATRLA